MRELDLEVVGERLRVSVGVVEGRPGEPFDDLMKRLETDVRAGRRASGT